MYNSYGILHRAYMSCIQKLKYTHQNVKHLGHWSESVAERVSYFLCRMITQHWQSWVRNEWGTLLLPNFYEPPSHERTWPAFITRKCSEICREAEAKTSLSEKKKKKLQQAGKIGCKLIWKQDERIKLIYSYVHINLKKNVVIRHFIRSTCSVDW